MKNRFFRILWRINAVLICLASILAIFVCAVAAVIIVEEITRRGSSRAASIIEPAKTDKLKVSDVHEIEGQNVVRCSLNAEDSDGEGSCSRGTTTVTRNYLYCDLLSGATHWLLPNNASVILSQEDFCFPADKKTVRWTSFRVVEKDTNHDGILSGSDLESFAVSQPNGTSYAVLLTGMENILESKLIEENKMIVFYRKEGVVFFSTIDLKEMKIKSTQNIYEKK